MGKESMKKKILILSIIAAILLIGTSLTSVIGTKSEQTKTPDSPLFSVRTQRSTLNSDQTKINCQYLGKGASSNLFLAAKPTLATALDRTMKVIQQNPTFFTQLLKTLSSNPKVLALLQENGVNKAEFTSHLNRIKNNPSLFLKDIQNAGLQLNIHNDNTPLPLGLNTSNPFGCIITAIVMIPVVLVITLIVVLFTIRIIQCMNIDEVMNQLMDQILQELFPPGYNI